MTLEYHIMYSEINIISMVIGALLLMRLNNLKQMKGRNQFSKAVISMGLFALSDMLALLSVDRAIPSSVASILFFKSCYFMTSTIMGYYWLIYFEYKAESKISQNRKLQVMLTSLAIFQFVMTLFNIKYGFFFYVNDGLAYQRGKLFFVQYFFSYFYVGLAIIHALYCATIGNNYIDRSYVATLALFPVAPSLAGIFQFFYPQLPMASISMILSALLVYFDNLDEITQKDNLTGANNRRHFMSVLSKKMKMVDTEKNLYLLMVDVDFFKEINDAHGHTEGDNALVKVVEALSRGIGRFDNRPKIGRYGGDEFIAVVETEANLEIEALIHNVEQALARICEEEKIAYPLKISIGYAKYEPKLKLVKDFINKADQNLYEVKQRHHQQKTGA